jgi:hypothetical protein
MSIAVVSFSCENRGFFGFLFFPTFFASSPLSSPFHLFRLVALFHSSHSI